MKMLVFTVLFKSIAQFKIEMNGILGRLVFGNMREKLVLGHDRAERMYQLLQLFENRVFALVGLGLFDRVNGRILHLAHSLAGDAVFFTYLFQSFLFSVCIQSTTAHDNIACAFMEMRSYFLCDLFWFK